MPGKIIVQVPAPRKFFRDLRHNTGGADIVGTDEAQPIEPLLLAQSHSLAQQRPLGRLQGVSIAQGCAQDNRTFRAGLRFPGCAWLPAWLQLVPRRAD